MAFDPTTGAQWPTLYNLTKMLDPDGSLADIGKVYTYTNEVMADIPYKEANGKMYHRITVEDGLPEGTWRSLNKGIRPKDAGTLQVDETIGLLENRAQADVVLARLSGNIAQFRKEKGDRIVRGLSKQNCDVLFYGDVTTYPEEYHGFAPRYDSLGKKTDSFGAFNPMNQVYSMGGSSNCTSVWLIGWGDPVYGIYPQGSKMGIETEDLGVIDVYDADGGVYRAYAEHFRLSMGLAVEDWRYVARLANIDVTATLNDALLTLFLNNLIDMQHALPDLKSVRPAYYMNRNVKSYLTKLAYLKTNLALNIGEVYGEKNVLNLNGIPIRQCDSITLTETALS